MTFVLPILLDELVEARWLAAGGRFASSLQVSAMPQSLRELDQRKGGTSMRRTAFRILLAITGLAAAVAPAGAAQDREPVTFEPFTLPANRCGFPIDIGVVSNKEYHYMANSDLALAMVRWAVREERTPSVAVRIPVPPLVLLTKSQMQRIFPSGSRFSCRSA